MPELPEIEVLVSQLGRVVAGRLIAGADVRHAAVFKPSAGLAGRGLSGKTVTGAGRRGKYFYLALSPAGRLWFHLGMTGQLLWAPGRWKDDPHAHFFLRFRDTPNRLVFRDPRKFGRVIYLSGAREEIPENVGRLGPEPFKLDDEGFIALFRARKAPIKNLLLNQRLVAGLGNIYADESLYRAGIDPRRRACRLGPERLARLRRAVCDTLKEAIKRGGSSIDDYRHLDGRYGAFQKFHQVYGRAGRKCLGCGHLIRRIRLAGRSASFCPKCQT